MVDVFISYSQRERALMLPIKKRLEALGLILFVDVDGRLDGEPTFPEALDKGVRASKAVLGCWSPWALTRPWVQSECAIGKDENKLVAVECVALTTSDVPTLFYLVDRKPLTDFDGVTPHEGWAMTLSALAAKLKLWVEKHPEHTEEMAAREKIAVLEKTAIAERAALGAPQAARSSRPAVASGGGFIKRLFSGEVAQPASEVAVVAAEWKQLQSSSDPIRLRSFARQFPGYYGDLAAARAVALEEAASAAEWKQLQSSVDLVRLRGFARQSPGHYGQLAAARAATLEEAAAAAERTRIETERQHRHEKAWKAAQKAANVADFEQFLKEFSDSPHVGEVRQRLDGLRQHEEQAAAWAAVEEANDIAQLEQFALQHPGKFAALAKERTKYLKSDAALKPGRVIRDIDIGPEMVLVPPGKFSMGAPDGKGSSSERPCHEVAISYPLLVGKHPITFAEWGAALAAGGVQHKPQTHRDRLSRTLPVHSVSWHDASAYVAWLSTVTGKSYRLLSEAEWEYCSRAGTTTGYAISGERAYWARFWASRGPESAEFNQFGLSMQCDVSEWCEDAWHESYQGAPIEGSARTSADQSNLRVYRGGRWKNSWERDHGQASNRDDILGFRVARTVEL